MGIYSNSLANTTTNTVPDNEELPSEWWEIILIVVISILIIAGFIMVCSFLRKTCDRLKKTNQQAEPEITRSNRVPENPFWRQELVDMPLTEVYTRRSSLQDGFMIQLSTSASAYERISPGARNMSTFSTPTSSPPNIPQQQQLQPGPRILQNISIDEPPSYDLAIQEPNNQRSKTKIDILIGGESFESDISAFECPPSYFAVQNDGFSTGADS